MNILNTIAAEPTFVLAASTDNFFSSGIGGVFKSVLVAIGVIIVFVGLFKATKEILAGATPKAVKIILGTLLLAAIMFDPTMIETVINAFSTVIRTLFDSLGDIFGTGK